MAINYTSYIPRQVIDTGIPLDQAPDFSRLMDRQDWRLNGDNGMNRYQYLTPSDFRYWASQKQEGGDPQDLANVQRGQAATALADSYNIAAGQKPTQQEAPKSELDMERERLRNKFQAPLHDDSNAWVRSANRGRAAIDSGNELKPTPQVFSKDFATRTLPSGSANTPINYDTLGDDINEKGIQLMRDTGTWSEDELKDPSKINMNWGMHQALDAAGGIRHTQAEYEAEQERKRREYLAAMMRDYGGAAGDAISLGIPADDNSANNSNVGSWGNSVADYYNMDNAYPAPSYQDYSNQVPDNYSQINYHSPYDSAYIGGWAARDRRK